MHKKVIGLESSEIIETRAGAHTKLSLPCQCAKILIEDFFKKCKFSENFLTKGRKPTNNDQNISTFS